MSTLERGQEIENDFYHLKSQEWACEPIEAQQAIEKALKCISDSFKSRREKGLR